MDGNKNRLRVAIYGAGSWANRTHIPNLQRLEEVDIVAVCDLDPGQAAATAAQFAIERVYTDGHAMLDAEDINALWSVVPAFARTDVEATAARGGVHLFSEKPQSTTMAVARTIADAVDEGEVLSTVCFRERYRPLFRKAKQFLADKKTVHVRFQSHRDLAPAYVADRSNWHDDMEKAGGPAFDWGVHAVDYARFMTGLDITHAQAFYHHPKHYNKPLSSSFNFSFASGATMTMDFISATPVPPEGEPPFTVFFEGGYLALWQYDRIEVNGKLFYSAEDFDPWFEQDRVFVEAIRNNNDSGLLNDYRDGLSSLAPVLSGWESANRGGEMIDVLDFMQS